MLTVVTAHVSFQPGQHGQSVVTITVVIQDRDKGLQSQVTIVLELTWTSCKTRHVRATNTVPNLWDSGQLASLTVKMVSIVWGVLPGQLGVDRAQGRVDHRIFLKF